MQRPHLAWPVQLDPSGRLLYVEQNSDQDIASCLATCVLWPEGTNDLKPSFGARDQAFLQDLDLDGVRQALLENEPRAVNHPVLEDDRMPGFIASVRLEFASVLGDPQP